MNKYLRFITDPLFRFSILASRGFYNRMDDEQFLKRKFKMVFKRELNLENPQTFNEKLQWMKLYDRKPEYTKMVDKYEAKKYVADIIGEEYIIPTLGLWDSFDEIDFDSLPEQFVLKCTHDSGGLIICKDKKRLDLKKAKKKIEKSLKTNYYWRGREWPYKNVVPRIVAEKYMQDGSTESLPVYKFFCFDGKATVIQTIQNDKTAIETVDYFDREWNLLELKQNFPNSQAPLSKPKNFEQMLKVADILSKDKKGFLRVDLYEINGQIYFSEFTFFSDGGTAAFSPDFWDYRLGDLIKLK